MIIIFPSQYSLLSTATRIDAEWKMLSSKFYLSSIFLNQRFRLLSNKFVEKLDLCFLIVRFFSTAAVAATVAATAAEGLMR